MESTNRQSNHCTTQGTISHYLHRAITKKAVWLIFDLITAVIVTTGVEQNYLRQVVSTLMYTLQSI